MCIYASASHTEWISKLNILEEKKRNGEPKQNERTTKTAINKYICYRVWCQHAVCELTAKGENETHMNKTTHMKKDDDDDDNDNSTEKEQDKNSKNCT